MNKPNKKKKNKVSKTKKYQTGNKKQKQPYNKSQKHNKLNKHKRQSTEKNQETDVTKPQNRFNLKYIHYLIILLLSFGLYFNTISHDYVLDDAIVITHNDFVKDGIKGIKDIVSFNSNTSMFGKKTNLNVYGRYRPLSYITYAIEWELSAKTITNEAGEQTEEGNPHVSHFVNIVLYAITGILLYMVFVKLLETRINNKKILLTIPLVITLLYVVHPVHTEVVANIKSRDEILAFLFSFLTLWFSVKYIESERKHHLVWSFLAFFLALMSKESAITFFAIVPLTLYFFTKTNIKRGAFTLLPMAAGAIIYFIIRQAVTGEADPVATAQFSKELINNPFVEMDTAEKYATIFHFLGVYLRLLFFPHPLTIDYYSYHIPITHWNDLWAIVPLILYFAIGIYAVLTFRKKSLITYGICFFLITLSVYSNLIVQLGIFVNERFLYSSSLGFCIVITAILFVRLPQIAPKKSGKLTYFVAIPVLSVILLLFAIKTISRNRVWSDNLTLFANDVQTSRNSAFGNYHYGALVLYEAQKLEDDNLEKNKLTRTAINHLRQAIKIHPKYKKALLSLGDAYCEYNLNFDSAMIFYNRLLAINPNKKAVYDNVVQYAYNYDSIEHKIEIFKHLLKLNPKHFKLNYNLGMLYLEKKQDIPNTIKYLQKAASIRIDKDVCNNLATAYYFQGKMEKAIGMYNKALKVAPNDQQVYRNLALAYMQIGNRKKATECTRKAEQIAKKQKNK